ncbi:hypothetical protein ACK8OR_17690 [Jannaschia sp. KMU-145]|uniref:hypothetical protein n=1 Tax=Jannaschia halovivens TaxID=3388667 RepID=UPI00396AF69D
MLKLITCAAAALLAGATVVAACPDWRQNGAVGRFSGADLWEPRLFDITAGGTNNLRAQCGSIYKSLKSDRGDGYFPTPPDFTIETPGMSGYTLEIAVVSECDSALLVNTPAGNWYYDDDDNGNLDAKITLTSPSSGILDIWVGTHDGQFCDAELRLETFK